MIGFKKVAVAGVPDPVDLQAGVQRSEVGLQLHQEVHPHQRQGHGQNAMDARYLLQERKDLAFPPQHGAELLRSYLSQRQRPDQP